MIAGELVAQETPPMYMYFPMVLSESAKNSSIIISSNLHPSDQHAEIPILNSH